MNIPANTIILWSGSVGTIPPGFVLCDGANGTPDLRNRFVVGAGDAYNPDDSGGSNSHVHDFTGDGHTHVLSAGANIQVGANYAQQTESTQVTGTTQSTSNLPLYYALAYIMKT